MARIKMDGSVVFNSTAKAAAWLHATGQTRASDAKNVANNVNRAVRDGGRAYGHTFEREDR